MIVALPGLFSYLFYAYYLLVSFYTYRMLGNEKILIHFNLSLALVLAQTVFVSSSDAHTNPVSISFTLRFHLVFVFAIMAAY